MFKQLLFVPLILLLGACSMTQYKVSEAQINQYLKEKVTFDKQLGIPGIMSSQIHLDHLQSRIGRTDPNRIELDAAGDLRVNSSLGSQQITVNFVLSARPDYVPEQGAIYLRDLHLLSVSTQPANIGAALTPLLPAFNESLSLFLSQTPVYRLDNHHKGWLKEKVDALNVEPGQLVIPFHLF
ncbi:MAG: lipoprotein [Aeromonas sp.]